MIPGISTMWRHLLRCYSRLDSYGGELSCTYVAHTHKKKHLQFIHEETQHSHNYVSLWRESSLCLFIYRIGLCQKSPHHSKHSELHTYTAMSHTIFRLDIVLDNRQGCSQIYTVQGTTSEKKRTNKKCNS